MWLMLILLFLMLISFQELRRFCSYLNDNLRAIEKCHKEDNGEDNDNLESLSKEELIARLREKSK